MNVHRVVMLLSSVVMLNACLGGNDIKAPTSSVIPPPEPQPPTPTAIQTMLLLQFDEASSTPSAQNSVGGEDFIVITGLAEPERVSAVQNTGLRTDGYSTWVQGALVLPATSDITVQTWVALENYPADAEVPYAQLTPSALLHQATADSGFSIAINAYGHWSFKATIEGMLYTLDAPENFPLYAWTHVAAVVDGTRGNMHLYLNGELVASSEANPVGAEIDFADTPFVVGKGYRDKSLGMFPLVNAINGIFDNTEVLVGAMTGDAIKAQYSAQLDDISQSAELALQVPDSRFINDLQRPIYHAMPPAAWANEPHGMVEVNGQYHLFYQRTPNGPFKTQMHWGHLSSPDFVNWAYQQDALWPEVAKGSTQSSDMKGIWSGDVVVDGDSAYAFYTSVNYSDAFNPGISVATSALDDLQTWTKLGPIIDRSGADDMRDPYLWQEGDTWHMIIGAIKNGRGYLLHYSSQNIADPSSWLRSDFTSAESFAAMGPNNTLWEMPIFEKISADKYVLLVNPVGGGYSARGLYWIGTWSNGQFVPDFTNGKFLDLLVGHISPTLARNAQGHITAIGIVDERRSSEAQLAAGWTQTFSAPRVWGLADDNATLTQRASPDLAALRIAGSLSMQNAITVNGETALYAQGRQVEIIAQLDPNQTANKYGVIIGASADGRERTIFYYDSERKQVVLDKRLSSLSPSAFELNEQVGAYDEAVFGKPEKFHIFIDGSVVDVFINDQAAFSFRIYPTLADSNGIALYSQAADTQFSQVEVYQLRDMQTRRTYIAATADADGIAEGEEDGEVISLTLSNNTLVEPLDQAQWSINGLPMSVSLGRVRRIDDTHVEITLAGNSSADFDTDFSNLRLTVNNSQFTQSQLPLMVSAQLPVIYAQQEIVTQANLVVVGNDHNQISEGAEAGVQVNVVLRNNTFAEPLNQADWVVNQLPAGLDFTLTLSSDTEVMITFSGTAESYNNVDKVVTFSIAASAFNTLDPELFGQAAMSTSVSFVANKIYNVSLAAEGKNNRLVIGRFDSAVSTLAQGWIPSGDFADPATESAWRGSAVNSAAAQVGEGAVSTCEMNNNSAGCDFPTGTLSSPLFTLNKDYLYWLMAGGNGGAAVGLRVMDSVGNLLFSYQPNSCGPSFIDGNNDWTVLDVSQLADALVRVQFFDEETEACGFVSFDHIYQSDRNPDSSDGQLPVPLIDAGVVNLTTEQLQNLSYRISLPYADSDETVIGRFDDANQMLTDGWLATGVFVAPVDASAWQGTAQSSSTEVARVGSGALSTCEIKQNSEGCDAPMGSLTSPSVLVTAAQPILSFAMVGGNGSAAVGLRVLSVVDDSVLQTYTPNACGPSYINGNEDWVSLDLSAHIGETIKLQLFDEDAGGCGFVSVDHIHFSAGQAVNPTVVQFNQDFSDFSETVNDSSVTHTTVNSDAFTQVIGSFDDAQQTLSLGWQATGVFTAPAAADSWSGTARTSNAQAARVGRLAVSTCEINNNAEGCDAPTGTLLSPVFKVDAMRPFLNFLMSGGNGMSDIGVKVLNASSGGMVANFSPNSCAPSHIDGDDDWHNIDLSSVAGQFVQLKIYDNESGGCGFISFDHVHMSATAQ